MGLFDAFKFKKADTGTSVKKSNVASSLYTEQAQSQLITMMSRAPDLDETLRKAGIKRHHLYKLLSDDEIYQAVDTRVSALRAVPYSLYPSEGKQAEFIFKQLAKHADNLLKTHIKAAFFGYVVQEGICEQTTDGYVGYGQIIEKPMQWFEPKTDGTLRYFPDNGAGGLDGLIVDTEYKFFYTVNDPTYMQPQGDAILSRLYWPWYFRQAGWKFWAKFLERFGSPILVGKSSDATEMMNGLLNAHGSAVVAIDLDDSVEALGAASGNSGQGFDTFEKAIVRRINKVILGQTLTSGTDGSGSRALGEVHNEVRMDKLHSDIRLVNPVLQHFVNAICDLNGFERHEITLATEKSLVKERAERDKILNEIGVEFTDTYFQDKYSLDADHFKMRVASAPTAQFTALPAKAFSFKADAQKITPEQQEIDNLAPASYSLLDTEQIKALVLASNSAEDLQSKLFELLPSASIEQFNEVLSQALFTADMLGYKHSSEGA